jgi:protein-tyrosine phosphatase
MSCTLRSATFPPLSRAAVGSTAPVPKPRTRSQPRNARAGTQGWALQYGTQVRRAPPCAAVSTDRMSEYDQTVLKPMIADPEAECVVPRYTERDFEKEMENFPKGVVFARGDGNVTTTATTDDYNLEMQSRMRSNICYIHEAGLNYTHVLPGLIVGSCPQSGEDIKYLSKLGVTRILNLQQQIDWEKFGIDMGELQHSCHEMGNIEIVRAPMEDFSSASLVANIPHAGQTLHELMEDGHMVYVHCTAGLGRAPAVAIAYLHWMCGMTLKEAYTFVTARRPCHPKAAAIRQATMNLSMGDKDAVSFSWQGSGQQVKVLGTFNNWETPGYELERFQEEFHLSELCLPVGIHMYKYIVDNDWTVSDHEPKVVCAEGNLNNVVLVRGSTGGGRCFPPPAVN